MKAPQIMRFVYTAFAAAIPLTLFALSKGPDPRHTGAPGDKQLACATAGCHTNSQSGGPINFHGGSVSATFSQGSVYTPGTPVNITVSVSDPTHRQYGFQMSARLESNLAQAQAGRFIYQNNTGVAVVCDNEAPRSVNGNCPASQPVEFIEHTEPSSSSWSFSWTPPATAAGPVHFYIAGNAVDGNLSSDGNDHVYTREYVLTPTMPISISPGGITNAASFDNTALAPGSLASLFGVFTGTNTTTASSSPWLTTLSGLSVKFNNVAAPLYYVSATQVNVQVPWEMASVSTAAVTVTVNGVASPPQSIPISSTAPGVFQYGQNQGIATNALSANLITAANPARPGLTYLTIYCTGLGLVTNQPATGVAASSTLLSHATLTPTVTIGGVPTNATFAGLSPGFIGLYQINVQVPAGTPVGNSVPLIVLMAGKPAATVFIAVQP